MATTSAKQLLRKEMKMKLRQLLTSPEERQQISDESAIVHRKLLAHPWLLSAKRLSIYVSMGTEIETHQIIQWALKEGKEVFIPRFKKGPEPMEMLKLADENEFNRLDSTIWGIRQHSFDIQPPPTCFDGVEPNQNPLDLVLMPGLAFTPDGKRLGHGRGHYDRFLAECKERSTEMPKTIGLALRIQMLDDLPIDPLDKIVDLVLYA